MITYKEQVIIDKEEAQSMQMEIDNYLVCIEQALGRIDTIAYTTTSQVLEIDNLCDKIREVSKKLWKK